MQTSCNHLQLTQILGKSQVFYLYMEVRVMFYYVTCVCVWYIYEEKFGSSMWSFSWFGQKVNKIEVKGYWRR